MNSESNFPEVIPCANPGYATYIMTRKPVFKAHAHRGLAKSAFRTHINAHGVFTQDMALYAMIHEEESQWELAVVIKKGTRPSDYPGLWPSGK